VLSDLRDSGSLEQDANIIAFVYRDEIYNDDNQMKNIAEIITRKFRGGKVGTDVLGWAGDFQRFDNLEHRPDVEAIAEQQASKHRGGKGRRDFE
jgi:replicative DNA helicase